MASVSLGLAPSAGKLLANMGRISAPVAPLIEIAEIPKTDGQLVVESVDFLIDQNRSAHHTDQYEYPGLVVRRGQTFNVDITLARGYDAAAGHRLSLELQWGSSPVEGYNAHVIVPVRGVEGTLIDFVWSAKIATVDGAKVTVQIQSPVDSLIGRYKVAVCTKVGEEHPFRQFQDKPMFMLFNPWCKGDEVYMPDDEKRNEYVLDDMGMFFYGAGDRIGSDQWYFGQFELGILECVVSLLEGNRKRLSTFSSPVSISRLLSALVNAQDEGGILVGNWSGNYTGGTEPTAWSGSASIFEEYIRTGQPVCYGQCWVFGGLLTTALRAVGIPGRTVTNFSSAHDTDANCLIDEYFDGKGDPLDDYKTDSVWNFHVWNDAWMTRPDLPEGYGGWQAVDSTPQEESRGVFRTGPAPLTAVKNGNVYLNYDTTFVRAEVNACKVKWMQTDDIMEPWKMIDVETDGIGTRVLTKAVGKMEREDITDQYKPKEGSTFEYLSLFAANKYVTNVQKLFKTSGEEDTSVELILPDEDILIGKDFTVRAKLKKTCPAEEKRTVNLAFTCNTMYYTGVKARLVLREYSFLDLTDDETVHEWQVKVSDYLPNLVDQANMKFFLIMFVSENDRTSTKEASYRLTKPDLDVEAPLTVTAETPFKVDISFTNPLSTMLQGCFFHVEGPAVALHKKQPFRNIKGGETIKHQITMHARKTPGTKKVLVSFSSQDLIGVSGSAFVTVG